MKNDQQKTVFILSILFFLFFMPMALAWLFYTHQQWLPKHKTNRGQLITASLTLSQLNIDTKNTGKWRLFLIQAGPCDTICQQNVVMQRQIQRALGKDMDRLQRVVINFSAQNKTLPDAFWQGALPVQGEQDRFNQQRLQMATWLIADPIGNVMLSYSAANSPEDILKDLQHLLEVSKIG